MLNILNYCVWCCSVTGFFFFLKELILINLVVIFYVKDFETIACIVSLGAL